MNSYDPNRQYYIVTDQNGTETYQDVPVEETNNFLEEQKRAGNQVQPETYQKFRGDTGEDYEVPLSRSKAWVEEMGQSGKGFAPVVELENPLTGEKRKFAKWGIDGSNMVRPSPLATDDGFTREDQAAPFIAADRADYQAAMTGGWQPVKTAEPGKMAVAKQLFKGETYADADWDPKKMAAAGAAAVVDAAAGIEKTAVGMTADVGALASGALGVDGKILRDLKHGNEQLMNKAQATVRDKLADVSGMDDTDRAALDVTGGIAEEVGGIYGIGAAGKVVGTGLKAVGTGLRAINAPTFAKALSSAAAGTTAAMGASGYESIYDDETLKPLLESGNPADVARAKIIGVVKAAVNSFGGKIVNRMIAGGAPAEAVKEELSGKLAKLAGDMVKSGAEFAGFNNLNLWADAVSRKALNVEGLTPDQLLERTVSETINGFMMGLGMRGAGALAESGVRAAADQMRQDYFTGMYKEAVERAGEIRRDGMRIVGDIAEKTAKNQRAAQEKAAEDIMRSAQGKMPGSSVDLGTFSYTTKEGIRVSFDNGLVREGKDGQAEVVMDGVVIDRGGLNLKGVTADPADAGENARRAVILGMGIRNGFAKGEKVALPDVGDYQPRPDAGTDSRPVIVLRDADGNIVPVTGRGRMAAAKARGDTEIDAVVLDAKDGWNADNVKIFDTIENLMDGRVDAAGCVKTFTELGWPREQLAEGGLLKSPAAKAALKVCEKGAEPLRALVADSYVPVHVAEQLVERVNRDTVAAPLEQLAGLQRELATRISAATRAEARAVAEQVRQVLEERGGEVGDAAKLVDEAVERARGEMAGERAELNGQDRQTEETIEATPVETGDGKLTTVGELERANEAARDAEGEGREGTPGTATVSEHERQLREDATSLQLKASADGSYSVPYFPAIRVEVDADGKQLVMTGLSPENFADPANMHKTARMIGELAEKASEKGVTLNFEEQFEKDVVDALDYYLENIYRDPAVVEKSNIFMRRLEKSGLAKGVVTDQEQFDEALRNAKNGGERFVADGMTYGFTDGENIYLNPKFFGTRAGLNTKLHEFGHLAIIATKKVNPAVYSRGMNLIEKTDYFKEVSEHPDYAELDVETRRQEALTRMIADRGMKLEGAPKSVGEQLKQWLVEFWNSFGKAIGLKEITPEKAAWMTVEQVADAIRAEMLSGRRFGTTRSMLAAQEQAGRNLKRMAAKRSPQAYVESGAGRVSPAFEFWANNHERIMNVPRPGEFGWDTYNRIVNGAAKGDRARIKRILCGDKPRLAGQNGASSNDMILQEYNRRHGGEYTTEADFEQLVYDLLDSHAAFERWRKEGAETAEERAYREMEEQENLTKFDPEELEAAGVPTSDDVSMLFSRGIVNGKETAVAIGHPLSAKEARDPNKVLGVLSKLVGKSAAQIGETELTRITAKSVEHVVMSGHAQHSRRSNGREGKKLWRGTVAGMSVLDDIVATSALGRQENASHFNYEWKKRAKFYRADTRFAIDVGDGKAEVYPCELVVAEINGKRYVYDLTAIGNPTLTATTVETEVAPSKDRVNKDNTIGLITHRGIESQSPDNSVPHSGGEGNGNLIYSRGGRRAGATPDEQREQLMGSMRFGRVKPGLAAGKVGGVRVTEAGADGYGGAGFAGEAHARELGLAVDASANEGVAFELPELVRLYKDITSSPAFPQLVKAFAGQKWMGRVYTQTGKLQLTRDMFGIVDSTDQARIKAEMKEEGYFRNENENALMDLIAEGVNVEGEKRRSELELENRLERLGDERIAGRDKGGNTAPKIVLAHEIGHIVCDLPKRSNMGPLFDGLQTVGHGLVGKFQEWESKYENEALRNEALGFIAKWRGTGTLPKEAEDYFARKPREIYAECFGAFLSAPKALQREAPTVYAEMLDAIGRNAALQEAWNRVKHSRGEGPKGALGLVRREWEKQRKFTAQVDARNLERDLRTEPGSWWERAKRKFAYVVDGMQGPVFVTLTSAEKQEYARIKKTFKARMSAAKDDPAEQQRLIDQKRWAEDNVRAKVLGVKAAVLSQQRGGGGVDHIFLQDVVGDVLQQLEKAGIDRDSFDWYLALKKNVMYRGKADVAGLDPRLAQQGLDEMRSKDPAKYAKLEECAQMFHAVCQREVLDAPEVKEAMGEACINAWKERAAYVTTKRILSADEVEAVNKWKAEHPGQNLDMMQEFELMREMHLGKSASGGATGAVFKKTYEGSFKVTASESTATIEKMLQLKAFARQNHVVAALADFVRDFNVEGWKEIKSGEPFNDGGRYGRIAFLRGGERRELVCPKTVAVAFKNQGKLEHFPLIRQILWANTFFKQAVTVYSGAFGVTRNVRRNRVSSDQLNSWKRPTVPGMIAQALGFGPEAQLAAHVMEAVSRRTGWLHGKGIDAVFGPATNIYWMHKATRCAKMALKPGGFREAMDRAHELMRSGDRQAAAELMDDIRVVRELLRMNVAASPFAINAGTADMVDLNGMLKGTGWAAEIPWKEYPLLERFKAAKGWGGKLGALRDAKMPIEVAIRQSWPGKIFDATLGKMADFTRMEEMRQKLIDFLAAERCNLERQAALNAAPDAAARAKLPPVMSKDYLATKIAMNSGSPAAEARGPLMTLMETFIPFSTAAQKSARRNVRAAMENPMGYFGKVAPAMVGRFNRNVLFLGGGMFAVIAAVRQMFQGDEDKQRKLDQVEAAAKTLQRGIRNTSSYMLQNYHVMPVYNFGPYCTLGLRVPMGDGEKMFAGFADAAAAAFCGSGTGGKLGLSAALMDNYDVCSAIKQATIGSGWFTDINKIGGVAAFAQDTVLAAIGSNPTSTFTGQSIYPDDVFATRFRTPEFAQMMLRKGFEDLGGGAIMQMGHIDDMGTLPPEAKTIFHALHTVPFVSSVASGFLYMSCAGNERTAARIRKAGEKERAMWSLAAKRMVQDMIDRRVDTPSAELADKIRSTYDLDEEEWMIVNVRALNLQRELIQKAGCADLPILKAWRSTVGGRRTPSWLREQLIKSQQVLGIDDL